MIWMEEGHVPLVSKHADDPKLRGAVTRLEGWVTWQRSLGSCENRGKYRGPHPAWCSVRGERRVGQEGLDSGPSRVLCVACGTTGWLTEAMTCLSVVLVWPHLPCVVFWALPPQKDV